MFFFEVFKFLKLEIVRVYVFFLREGEFGEFVFKNLEINVFVEELGFFFYCYQVEVLEKFYVGKNIVVIMLMVSGKSEIFCLVIFDFYFLDLWKIYFFVYFMWVFINNQFEKFQRVNFLFYCIIGKFVFVKILMGDVFWEERRRFFCERLRVVFIILDMFYYNIL